MGHKRSITNQQYEDYWKLTLEYSDFCGEQFNTVLGIIVDYIDKNSSKIKLEGGISGKLYDDLQDIVECKYHKADSASTRKSINQFFKLGFINNGGYSYHFLTKQFLEETNEVQKRLLYSKIVYDNACFNRSTTVSSNDKQINFLIKTLEECGTLSKDDLFALIYTDVTRIKKGYLVRDEIDEKLLELTSDHAMERKYNQVNYLFNLCKKLTDIYVDTHGTVLSIDPKVTLDIFEKKSVRDSYLQRLYKLELIDEYKIKYHTAVGKCVCEHLAYPILIASHIKPYKDCSEIEAFDKDNGLLLSRNMDALFDGGLITFDDTGRIIISKEIEDENLKNHLKNYRLDSITYNARRRYFMDYHRQHVFHL